MNYLKLYNHHIPQRAIDSKTPILALEEWQKKRPELFVKRVHDQAGLDILELMLPTAPGAIEYWDC